MTATDELLAASFIARAHAVLLGRISLYVLFVAQLVFVFFGAAEILLNELLLLALCATLAYVSLLHLPNPTSGRWIAFGSLLLDALVHLYLTKKSGYIISPLMAVHPIFTASFLLLFHNPLIMAVPLGLLPLATGLSMAATNPPSLSEVVFALVLYSLLDAFTIFFIHLSQSKEQELSKALLALEEKKKELSLVMERQRIAREFHDGVGAGLTSMVMQCEYAMSKRLSGEELSCELSDIKKVGLDSIDDMRRSISLLNGHFAIEEQMEIMGRNFHHRHHIPLTMQGIDHLKNLSKDRQISCCRITQEALNNILKHAAAASIEVVGFAKDGGIGMAIVDDGIGFDASLTKPNHFGLANIRERTNLAGGTLTITSKPQAGTRIEVFFS